MLVLESGTGANPPSAVRAAVTVAVNPTPKPSSRSMSCSRPKAVSAGAVKLMPGETPSS